MINPDHKSVRLVSEPAAGDMPSDDRDTGDTHHLHMSPQLRHMIHTHNTCTHTNTHILYRPLYLTLLSFKHPAKVAPPPKKKKIQNKKNPYTPRYTLCTLYSSICCPPAETKEKMRYFMRILTLSRAETALSRHEWITTDSS